VRQVIGITDGKTEIITHEDKWHIMTAAEIEQAYDFALTPEEQDFYANILNEMQLIQFLAQKENAASWTCGNNCTDRNSGE
jgi:hypothetical protein